MFQESGDIKKPEWLQRRGPGGREIKTVDVHLVLVLLQWGTEVLGNSLRGFWDKRSAFGEVGNVTVI